MTDSPTHLTFHHDGKALTSDVQILRVLPFTELDAASQALFKLSDEQDHHVVIVDSTIFHPQGGGQPSDIGTMKGQDNDAVFTVEAVKMDAITGKTALHVGFFTPGSPVAKAGDTIRQEVDAQKRLLFSRLHTAGHVLGAAVRHLLEKEVDNFDELKASHFPDSAACEFQGLIEGKWKEPIQQKVNEYVAADLPVEIDWWDEEDFRKNGMESQIPDKSLISPDGKFRVVNIRGAEIYPCGGTHVDSTRFCDQTVVKKIARSKGQSRVSYTVKD